MSESKLQIAFINWMRVACPEVTVFHVYNETGRNGSGEEARRWAMIEGKKKKDRGVLAGVHDNHLIWPHRNYATIELKDPDKPKSANKYSDNQAIFATKLDAAGFPHACCQNGEQIEAAIRSFGLNPKVRFPGVLVSTKKVMFMQELFDVARGD